MIVRKLRLQRGWSQEQLAEMSDLSVRTIQRAERGQSIGSESLKSLAAVFEVQISDLKQEKTMTAQDYSAEEERTAIEYVRDLKGFYTHLISYVAIMGGLVLIDLFTSPGTFWAVWPMLGWGIGVLVHGVNVFEMTSFFGPDWEKKQIEKRLDRKL